MLFKGSCRLPRGHGQSPPQHSPPAGSTQGPEVRKHPHHMVNRRGPGAGTGKARTWARQATEA